MSRWKTRSRLERAFTLKLFHVAGDIMFFDEGAVEIPPFQHNKMSPMHGELVLHPPDIRQCEIRRLSIGSHLRPQRAAPPGLPFYADCEWADMIRVFSSCGLTAHGEINSVNLTSDPRFCRMEAESYRKKLGSAGKNGRDRTAMFVLPKTQDGPRAGHLRSARMFH